LNTKVSQGSVATHLRCGGMITPLHNHCRVCWWQYFENCSTFAKVSVLFFWLMWYLNLHEMCKLNRSGAKQKTSYNKQQLKLTISNITDIKGE